MKVTIPIITGVLTILTIVGGAGYKAYGHFEKTADHAADIQEMEDRDRRVEILRLEERRDDYQYQLLDESLTEAQREWIRAQIANLQNKIDCLTAKQC